MSIKNKVQLIGHVGDDVNVITTKDNKKVANFSLATNENYTTKNGEKKETTQWHNIVAWGKTAEIIQQLEIKKGSKIAVSGKLTYSSWESEETTKYKTEILIDSILKL